MRIILTFSILIFSLPLSAASLNSLLIKGGKAYNRAQYGKALDIYKLARQEDPSSDKAQFNTAASLYKLKDYPQAAALYKTVAGASEEFKQDSYFNMGNAYFRAGDNAKAKAAYKKAILLNPRDKEAVHNLQILLQQNKENEESENKKQDEDKEKNDQQGENNDSNSQPDQAQRDAERLIQMAREQERKDRSRSREQYGEAGDVEKDW
ncbi:tetratricopeptide (TPR) repeat protein [Elusimicrobium simillimum]|uniref:tetratricopeptide repeat protein n=1 Tax=Elusimicrobium simillimum TaxID=3143438 RepID=UPI003C6FD926